MGVSNLLGKVDYEEKERKKKVGVDPAGSSEVEKIKLHPHLLSSKNRFQMGLRTNSNKVNLSTERK